MTVAETTWKRPLSCYELTEGTLVVYRERLGKVLKRPIGYAKVRICLVMGDKLVAPVMVDIKHLVLATQLDVDAEVKKDTSNVRV